MTTQSLVTLSAADLRADDAGEPRILDLDLAARLGFGFAYDIRQLITRNADELKGYGTLVETADRTALNFWHGDKNSGPEGAPFGASQAQYGTAPEVPKKGRKPTGGERPAPAPPTPEILPRGVGRPGRAYLLNESQALLVAVLSQAPGAPAVRRMLIDAFNAYRKGPAPLPEAAKLPPLMIDMTPSTTVNVEIQDRAGLRGVRGKDMEAPSTKAAVRKATVAVFLEMYTVPSAGSSIPRTDLFASWKEYRAENALPPIDVPSLFRLIAEAGYEDDGRSFHGLRYKLVPGATPQLTQRRGHTGEPARLAALAAPSRPTSPALPSRKGDA